MDDRTRASKTVRKATHLKAVKDGEPTNDDLKDPEQDVEGAFEEPKRGKAAPVAAPNIELEEQTIYIIRHRWAKFEPRCSVCKLVGRNKKLPHSLYVAETILRMLVHGEPLTQIMVEIEPWMKRWKDRTERITYESLKNHAKGHLNYRDAALRRLAERHAMSQGVDLDSAVERVTSVSHGLDMVIEEGESRIEAGVLAPESITEFLAALKLRHQLNQEGAVEETVAAFKQQAAFIGDVLRDVMTDDQWQLFREKLAAARREKALAEVPGRGQKALAAQSSVATVAVPTAKDRVLAKAGAVKKPVKAPARRTSRKDEDDE